MIGNDVVDMAQARLESNWRRPGFFEKIFTDHEQLLINRTAGPEEMVWLLWSMKEAAYKIYHRQTKTRKFMPKDLQCTVQTKRHKHCTGLVRCFGQLYHTRSSLENGHIHTVAVTCPGDLEKVIEIARTGLAKDIHGIPYLLTSNGWQSVSVSHHGSLEKIVTLKPHQTPDLGPEDTGHTISALSKADRSTEVPVA